MSGKCIQYHTEEIMSKLLEALAEATAEDLEKIDEQVEQLETELDELVAEKRKRIDALKGARKVIDVAINGMPQRKKSQRKKATHRVAPSTGSDGSDKKISDRIFEYVSANGPTPMDQLAELLGTSTRAVAVCAATCKVLFRNGDDEISVV